MPAVSPIVSMRPPTIRSGTAKTCARVHRRTCPIAKLLLALSAEHRHVGEGRGTPARVLREFAHLNQHPRYLPRCVAKEFSEVRLAPVHHPWAYSAEIDFFWVVSRLP